MTTINFTVGVPSGAPVGNVDGEWGYISTYLILNPSMPVSSNVIFCIAPDLLASSGPASYTVLNGIQDGFSTHQVNALEGLFSHYIDSHDTSFFNQEATMIADWSIVNPSVVITGVDATVVTKANQLLTDALAGNLAIDPNLDFTTYLSDSGNQSFVSAVDPVPLPASMGLLMAAVIVLTTLGFRKKLGVRA